MLEGGTGVLYGGVRCCCVSHTGTTIECAVARVWHVTTYCGIHAIAARPARLVTRMQRLIGSLFIPHEPAAGFGVHHCAVSIGRL